MGLKAWKSYKSHPEDEKAMKMFYQDKASGYFWVGLTKLFAETECRGQINRNHLTFHTV